MVGLEKEFLYVNVGINGRNSDGEIYIKLALVMMLSYSQPIPQINLTKE